MAYKVYDGTIFKTDLEAAYYLKEKIEEICKDIVFIQFKNEVTIDQTDSYNILESFLHTNDFIHFCNFFPKAGAIYIKSSFAALRLTEMCKTEVKRGVGSVFCEGLNFYLAKNNLFIPAETITIGLMSSSINDTLCKPIKEWIDENL